MNIANVAIIDDTPENVQVLADSLADNYGVRFALSGMEGIDLVKNVLPDLVLLDVMMPEMDGYEVCARLKNEPTTRDIPIIFVTARNDPSSESRALAAGAVDFVHKPVNRDVLLARVRTHVALKRHIDQLRELATTDPLTGLANRRVLYEQLNDEWSRSTRRYMLLATLIVDIDHFKDYNDYYGHLMGDSCLQQVAGAISSSAARAGELVARYGGEEFAVLLPNTSVAEALATGERICQRVMELAIPHKASAVAEQVTVSVGLAVACPCYGAPPSELQVDCLTLSYIPSPDALLHAADLALYTAKRQGRNRVVSRKSVHSQG